MLCRACQETKSRGGKGRARPQWCSGCGHLLTPEDIAQQVQSKQSQLARFGLDASLQPLLERKGPARKGDR
jgi:hypothetical protein